MGQVGRPRREGSGQCPYVHRTTPISATYHYECPTCGYLSPKSRNSSSTEEFAGYHPHPVNQVAKYTYVDRHVHTITTDVNGKTRQETTPPHNVYRPTELPYTHIVSTHIIPSNPDASRYAVKRLGAPQVASMLETHYRNNVTRRDQDLVEKYTSGVEQPKIDVRWNDGNPVVTGGLTTLAIARKHFPTLPIGINYID